MMTTAAGTVTVTMIDVAYNTSDDGDEESHFDEQLEHGGLPPGKVRRIVLLTIVMALSLIGNSVIIIILTCSKTHRHLSRVNLFVLHLAIGDLSVLWTIGSEIIFEVYGEWKLGNVGCKLIMYIQIVTLSSTTYILCVMSFSRYQAICRPLDYTPSPRKMIAVAWAAAFFLALPYLLIYLQVQKGDHMECLSEGYTAPWQRRLNFIWLTCSVLVFPAIFISFCYFSLAKVVWQQGESQQMVSSDGTVLRKHCDIRVIPRAKIKTLKMSLSIVISFLVCWSGYFIVYNILIWSDYTVEIPEAILTLVETLALLNSVMNPLIYGCFNLRIRQGLREACCFSSNVRSAVVDKSPSPLSEPTATASTATSCSSTVLRIKGPSSNVRVRRAPQPQSELSEWQEWNYQQRYQQQSHRHTHGRARRATAMYLEDGGASGTSTSFDFAQSTRHIQKKRVRRELQAQTYGHGRVHSATAHVLHRNSRGNPSGSGTASRSTNFCSIVVSY